MPFQVRAGAVVTGTRKGKLAVKSPSWADGATWITFSVPSCHPGRMPFQVFQIPYAMMTHTISG